jgi:hypothetical protein
LLWAAARPFGEFTRRIMVRDQDFGEIPGTNKPTLLKPGAEKLCNFFGLEPEFTPVVEDIDWTGSEITLAVTVLWQ